MKRSLVITTAFCYSANDVRPLACSIHKNSPNTDLLIQTSSKDLSNLISLQKEFSNIRFRIIPDPPRIAKGRFSVALKAAFHIIRITRRAQQRLIRDRTVCVEEERPWRLSTIQCHFLIRRFFWAKASLLEQDNAHYGNIMLCDCRDVIVQGNPFQDLPCSITTGAEVNNLGDCEMNSMWVRQAYGTATLEALRDYKILCAGVTLGRREDILEYLSLICADAIAVMQRKRTGFLSNLDQAMHNKVLRSTEELDFRESGYDGLIATIGCADESRIKLSTSKKKVRINDNSPAVIHQYDRIPWLDAHIKHTYGNQ